MAAGAQDKGTSDETTPAAILPPPEGYLSPADVPAKLRELERNKGVKILQIASTYEGRAVFVASFAEKDIPGRPAVLIAADPNGDKPVATQIAMFLCEYFATGDSPLTATATVYISRSPKVLGLLLIG